YLLVPPNPYRGLEPFTAAHSDVFFGRDEDIRALTERVLGQPVVLVVGPSGVGKSSVVQAGLVPRLQAAQRWSVALVRPGQDPWHRLAAGLLRAQRVSEVDGGPVDSGLADRGLADGGRPAARTDIEREIQRLRHEGFGPAARYLRSIGRPLLVV